jgi:hypothetical protein
MIKAMNKAENFTNPGPPDYTDGGFGVSGPINAVVDRYIPAQQRRWIPTFANLGIERNSIWLAGENVGAAYHSSAIDPVSTRLGITICVTVCANIMEKDALESQL